MYTLQTKLQTRLDHSEPQMRMRTRAQRVSEQVYIARNHVRTDDSEQQMRMHARDYAHVETRAKSGRTRQRKGLGRANAHARMSERVYMAHRRARTDDAEPVNATACA